MTTVPVPSSAPPAATSLPWMLILAAGSGSRMGDATGDTPKQFLRCNGCPLFWHSALTAAQSARVGGIVFVFAAAHMAAATALLERFGAGSTLGLPWVVAQGGARRQDSVRNGLALVPATCTTVLVHDAARPFMTAQLIARVCQALADGATAVIPGVPVTDTIKCTADGQVTHTLPRDSLVAVQTPQGFALDALRAAHARADAAGWDVTDDATLLEKCGVPVRVVAGETANRKITTPEDLAMLDTAAPSPLPCTGYGYDVHRFGSGRPLRLGGVPIPGGMEVIAHSDGDVLLHALMDAILSCACAGDIGQHFPDTDPRFDNADAAVLLDDVLRIATDAGVQLVQADVTVITQQPKISPHRQAIQQRLAALLSLPCTAVNVKATTEEGLGFTGAVQGIKAVAVVTALRSPSR